MHIPIDSIPVLTGHHSRCARKGMGHSDGAKRISDTVNLHWNAIGWEGNGKWLAFRLQDGTGGMDLYDSKMDAVRHSSNPKHMMYLCLAPGGMHICEAEVMLRTARAMADWGLEDTNRIAIPRIAAEHRNETLRLLGG